MVTGAEGITGLVLVSYLKCGVLALSQIAPPAVPIHVASENATCDYF